MTVAATALATLIRRTFLSVCTDTSRPSLAGIYLEYDGERATMVSTDGHRLSKAEAALDAGPKLARGVIIPREGVMEIKRLLKASGTCDIGFAEGNISLRVQGITHDVALADGQKFPSWRVVVPREKHAGMTIRTPRATLRAALREVAPQQLRSTVTGYLLPIHLDLSWDRLIVRRDDPADPTFNGTVAAITVAYNGPDKTVALNAKYIIEALGCCNDSKEVVLQLGGPFDPCMLRPADSHDFIGVVMPMRP